MRVITHASIAGKTAQTIAFLTHLHDGDDDRPNLIVVPSSTLHNWEREVSRFAPAMTTLLYHGAAKERTAIQRDVLRKIRQNEVPNFVITTYNMLTAKTDRAFLRRFNFNYLVLDEAHAIKNPKSQRYVNLTKMARNAEHRLLLTGTPLQNNLQELFALLNFLMPDVLQYDSLSRILDAPRLQADGDDETSTAKELSAKESRQSLEQLYIKRARKILNPFILRRLKSHVSNELVPKVDAVRKVPMPAEQQRMYRELLETSKRSLRGASSDGTSGAGDAAVIDGADDDEDELVIDDDDDGGGNSRKRKTRSSKASQGGGEGMRSPLRRRARESEKKGATANIIMQLRKMANHPLLCRQWFDDARIARVAQSLQCTGADEFHDYALADLIEDLKVNSDFEIWRLCESYATEALKRECPPRSMLVDGAGKMRALLQMLTEITADGTKVLVFSQMTRMLDITEVVLQDAGIDFVRLDGSTPIHDRQPLIDHYTERPEIKVFLLSTRAGGLGINLTAANVVIFYDFGFNPMSERQAEDRAHRLGQTKTVYVHRLVSQNSIDEHIFQLAQSKAVLSDQVMLEGHFVDASDTKNAHAVVESMLARALTDTIDLEISNSETATAAANGSASTTANTDAAAAATEATPSLTADATPAASDATPAANDAVRATAVAAEATTSAAQTGSAAATTADAVQ